MEALVKERIQKSEESLHVFQEFLNDKTNPEGERKAVEFAYLFELFTFSTLHELMPEYVPKKTTQIQIAQGLGGAREYITVEGGKVKISPDFYQLLKAGQELRNKKAERDAKLG